MAVSVLDSDTAPKLQKKSGKTYFFLFFYGSRVQKKDSIPNPVWSLFMFLSNIQKGRSSVESPVSKPVAGGAGGNALPPKGCGAGCGAAAWGA